MATATTPLASVQRAGSFIHRYADWLLAVGVLGLVLTLITPIPPGLLDVLIAVNIATSLMLLLVTMNTRNAAELSVFPTLLLFATLFRLGRVPDFHQTDNSTAATHDLRTGKRGFNEEYQALMDHLGMTPRTIGIGEKEQNGDIEASHGVLKRRLEQHPRERLAAADAALQPILVAERQALRQELGLVEGRRGGVVRQRIGHDLVGFEKRAQDAMRTERMDALQQRLDRPRTIAEAPLPQHASSTRPPGARPSRSIVLCPNRGQKALAGSS